MAGMVSGETTVITYTFFHIGARAALTTAEEQEEGRSYHLLNAMVLSSFLVEAYFNHLGEIKGYPEWNNGTDKRTSIWSKYRLLRQKVGLSGISIKEAYPLVESTIEFRNTMAHGRTETHKFSMESDDIIWPHQQKIPVGWQISLTNANVRSCFDACRAMIYELHREANLGDHPFSKMSSSQMRYSAG